MRHLGFLLIVPVLLLLGCEDKKETNLFKAQLCLDKATAATALDCTNIIEGQTSKRAYVLFCSARFLSRGVDDDNIVAALEQMFSDEESGSSTDPSSAAIANLAIPDDADNPTTYDVDFASETAEVCAQTGSDNLTSLSNLALIATASNNILDGFTSACAADDRDLPLSATCVKNAIDAYDNSATTADKESLGNAVISSQDSLCGEDGLFKEEEFCTDINQAVAGGGSASDVADALLGLL